MRKTIKTVIKETHTPDAVCCDIPLLIRIMEFAREESKSDAELHKVASSMLRESMDGEVLTMEHYPNIVPTTPAPVVM